MDENNQTLGKFIFDYLYKQGATYAFGIPGDFVLPTFRWLESSPIELITMTHEPSVGFAADAYARTNGIGLACVTYCVGGLNMVNSIACAYAEKSPVIVISGGPSMNDRRNDPLLHHKVKTFDTQRRIFEEITCANTILMDPNTAASEVMRVVEHVKTYCRPGYIEIPYDLIDKHIPITPPVAHPFTSETDQDSLNAFLEEVTQKLNQAERPVIIADIEIQRHGLTDAIVAFSKTHNIPIASTLLSKSIIRETNPLYIGVYSGGLSEQVCQDYVENSDCILMLGAFVSDVFLGQYTANITCDNTIIVTTEKASIGYHYYHNILFGDFFKGLASCPIRTWDNFENPNPPKQKESLTTYPPETPLTVEHFFDTLSNYLDENSTLVCDTGDSLIGALGLRTEKRNTFLSDAYYLSMGFAVPAAIGVLAGKEKGHVFAVVGDGAFQMTGMELSTAAKYGMPLIIIVINNDGYGTQRHIVEGEFNNIVMWDYAKVPDVIGAGEGRKVTTLSELNNALSDAVKSDSVFVIEVVVPRNDCSTSLRKMGEQLGKLRNAE